MEPILMQVSNLGKVYTTGGLFGKQETVALKGFDLVIPGAPPRITTIAGESGSGKTTLANLLLGFISPTLGSILFKGKDIWHLPKSEWLDYRRNVQAIFQDPYGTFNPFYQVDEVFETLIKKFRLAKDRAEGRRLTENALEVVGMRAAEILGKYPHQLSGGQRQRIMVARAVLLKPQLIVADEPVSMIDASLQVRILDIFRRLKDDYGISFLYITHDLSTAYQISDDICILYAGSLMESGEISAVIQSPQHPYSQLLVNAIPVPDPGVRWGAAIRSADEEQAAPMAKGCKFYNRCPYGMDICTETEPPLYEVGPEHYTACYLHRDKPVKEQEAQATA